MTTYRNKRKSNKRKPSGGSRIAALAVLAVVMLAIGLYWLMSPRGKTPEAPHPARHAVRSTPTPAPVPKPTPAPAPEARRPTGPVAPVPETARPGDTTHPHETATAKVEKTAPATPRGAKGQLALIIDDMGSTMQEARALAGIGLPMTFSIIPGLRSDREVASFAARSGIETMIHIPMQPKGWPQRRLEANGLLLSMDEAAIRERLGEYALQIPAAVGANNHMGSDFTEDEGKMRVVLEQLKGKGMFFIDSVTTPRTVGLRLAREMGMKAGKRNVFLDNEQNSSYIRGQLAQAVRLAKKNGSAIAICHPHPTTILTLAKTLPTLAGQGITLVPVSRLAR